jgi:hypothetical protein
MDCWLILYRLFTVPAEVRVRDMTRVASQIATYIRVGEFSHVLLLRVYVGPQRPLLATKPICCAPLVQTAPHRGTVCQSLTSVPPVLYALILLCRGNMPSFSL